MTTHGSTVIAVRQKIERNKVSYAKMEYFADNLEDVSTFKNIEEDVSLIDEAEADASQGTRSFSFLKGAPFFYFLHDKQAKPRFCSAHERFVEAAENLEQEGWRHEFKYKSIRFPSCLGHEDTLQLTV